MGSPLCLERQEDSENMAIGLIPSILLSTTFCGFVVTSPPTFGQTDLPSKPQLSVQITAERATLTIGQDLLVQVQVFNKGEAPILIANSVSTESGGAARIIFDLEDSQGRSSPPVFTTIRDFPAVKPSDGEAAAQLLSSWTLLYPHTSIAFEVPIHKYMFRFFSQPGRYKLSAAYASNGILSASQNLGLSPALLNSLPYKFWTGNISTNEITLTVKASNQAQK